MIAMRNEALPDVLTVNEVSQYLRVSKTTVCRYLNEGKLRAFRFGRSWRVRRNDLEHFINQHENMHEGEERWDNPNKMK